MQEKNEGTSLWVKLNTLSLLLMLVILISIGIKSCISEMQTDRNPTQDINNDVRLIEEYGSIQEMKLNRVREDAYNAEKRCERELSLLKERVEILEGKMDAAVQSATVNVGNVSTSLK